MSNEGEPHDQTTTLPPQAAKVEAEIGKVEAEAVKVIEKLDDPKTTDAQADKLVARLDSLDTRMDKLIEKLDSLAASPVAPAPAKTVQQAVEGKEGAAENPTGEPAPSPTRKAYVSKRWFGERAYE